MTTGRTDVYVSSSMGRGMSIDHVVMAISAPRGECVISAPEWRDGFRGMCQEDRWLDDKCEAIRAFVEQHRGGKVASNG